MAVMVEWWGGRDLRAMLPRGLLRALPQHVAGRRARGRAHRLPRRLPRARTTTTRPTSTSPGCTRPGAASGLGRRPVPALLRSSPARSGRTVVRAVTGAGRTRARSPSTRRIGFTILPGDDEVDGVAVSRGARAAGRPRRALRAGPRRGGRHVSDAATWSGARPSRTTRRRWSPPSTTGGRHATWSTGSARSCSSTSATRA